MQKVKAFQDMGHKKVIPNDILDKMIVEYEKGISIRQLAIKYNSYEFRTIATRLYEKGVKDIPQSYIVKKANEKGNARKRRKYRKYLDENKIRALSNAGWNAEKIANEMNIDTHLVESILMKIYDL